MEVSCFSVATALLLIHLMVSQRSFLFVSGLAFLAVVAAAALYEHLVLFRKRPTEFLTRSVPPTSGPGGGKVGGGGEEKARTPGRRPLLGYLVVMMVLVFLVLLPAATTSLTTAGIGAMAAWMKGADMSDAAWRGFFLGLLWCAVLLVYMLLRVVLMFLQFRRRLPGGRLLSTE